jgi:hypothetical protein
MLSRVGSSVGNLLKLLFWAVLVIALVYFGWKHREQVMAAAKQLIEEFRNLLARLFGGSREPVAPNEGGPQVARDTHKPFSSYHDPFTSGSADRCSMEQLVRYTFEAMEAWGRERGRPRQYEQTPLEYAQRLAVDHPSLGVAAQQLADLYSRVAYGRERISRDRARVIQQLWRHMRSTAAMPAAPSSP